jgi:O-antigen/teichoic acid export membrane protein
LSIKKLAGQTVIYGISHILPRLLNFILMTPYLTYKFDKDTSLYGIFSNLYGYSTIIIALMVFRMDTTYFRFANKENEQDAYSKTFIIMATISTIVFGLMLNFSQEIANWLEYPDQAYYVKWFAFILAFDAYTSLIYARFRSQQRPMRFMFFKFLNVVLMAGFTLFFLEVLPRWDEGFKLDIDAFIEINSDMDYVFLSNLLASFFVFLGLIPELIKFNFKFEIKDLKDMLKYAWPLVIIIVASSINQYGAAPLQNYFLEGDKKVRDAAIGIFGASAKIAVLLSLFTTAFNYAAEPFFFNQAKKDEKHTMNGVVAKVFTIFCCLAILGLYCYLDLTFMVVGSKAYRSPNIVPILLMSNLFLGLYYNQSIWYKLADKTIYGAYIAVAAVVVTVIVSAILIPIFGTIGTAWAALACFAFELVIGYYLGQKYYPISYPVKSILGYVLLTSILLIVTFIMRSWSDDLIIRNLLCTLPIIGFLGYFYVMDKQFINNLRKAN